MTELIQWWWGGGLPFPLSTIFIAGGFLLLVLCWPRKKDA